MDDEHRYSPIGRQIAGGWLLCVLIAALALGLAGTLHRGAAEAAAARMIPSHASQGVCQAVAQTPDLRILAGLHHLPPSMPHPDHRPRS